MNLRFLPLCLAVVVSVAGLACSQSGDTHRDETSAADETRNVAADNTARNKDYTEKKTTGDQSEDKADLDISAAIRRSIIDTDMSTNAKNCKIITENGTVTLRGVVESRAAKEAIEAIARSTPGVVAVTNEIEVQPS